jgi:hypothetical protein
VAGPANAKVYAVDASISDTPGGPWRSIETGWYSPQTGYWSSTFVGHPTWTSVYTGTRYWERADDGILRVTTGPTAYVARAARPGLQAIGVAVASAWFKPDPVLGGRKDVKKTDGQNGDFVLTSSFGNGSDTQPGQTHIRVVVHPAISAADATARGAFPASTGKPGEISTEAKPGAASSFGIKAYWVGQTADGQTARDVEQHWEPADTQYTVHYAPPGESTPEWVDLSVQSLPLKQQFAPVTASQQPVSWQPATLADGEDVQVAVFQQSSVLVKTTSTLVQISAGAWSDQENCAAMTAAVKSLIPVGYSGATDGASIPASVCVQPPVGLTGAPRFVKPPTHPVSTAGATAPHVFTDCLLTSAEFDSEGLYQATTCSPEFAHVSPDCYHFTSPRGLWGLHFDYMAVDIVPTAGQSGCDVTPVTAVYADHSNGGFELLFLTRTPVCGPIEGPTGEVPTETLEAILRGRYAEKCS